MIDNRDKIATHISDVMLKRDLQYEEEFLQWLEENDYSSELIEILTDEDRLLEELTHFQTERKEEYKKELLNKIKRRDLRRLMLKIGSGVAASLVAVAAYFAITHQPNVADTIQQPMIAIEKTAYTVPQLIKSNGEMILLATDSVTSEGVAVNDEKLIVDHRDQGSGSERMNKLIVPSHNSYSIVLSDGTKVVLNANSELEFPDSFGADRRVVKLKGEGYFEVAKDKKRQFIVSSNDVEIKVYGTKFNVNSYDIHNVSTFLLEGKVSVSTDKIAPVMMSIMQVANINNGVCRIEDVTDADEYIAWLSNQFVFNAQPLSEVVEIIERWYGVDFEIGRTIANHPIQITGAFDRNTDIKEMLLTIEKIGRVKINLINGKYLINDDIEPR